MQHYSYKYFTWQGQRDFTDVIKVIDQWLWDRKIIPDHLGGLSVVKSLKTEEDEEVRDSKHKKHATRHAGLTYWGDRALSPTATETASNLNEPESWFSHRASR